MSDWEKLGFGKPSSAILAIRLMAGGGVFLEGIKKFLFVEQWGAGRFTRIGIPAPHLMGPFVGAVEIVCGLLALVGLRTSPPAITLLAGICTVSGPPTIAI